MDIQACKAIQACKLYPMEQMLQRWSQIISEETNALEMEPNYFRGNKCYRDGAKLFPRKQML